MNARPPLPSPEPQPVRMQTPPPPEAQPRPPSIHDRLTRTVGDFARLLTSTFHRHDPKDADRSPLARAARIAGTHLGLKLAEVERSDDEPVGTFLARFAAASGACVRPVSLENLATLEGEGPIVGAATDGRPLVLLPRRFAGVVVLDPVTNDPVAPIELDAAQVGYALHPVLPATKLTYRSVMTFGMAGCVPTIAGVLAFGAVGSLLELASPIAFAFVASHVIPTDDDVLLLQICAALLLAMILHTLVFLAGQYGRTQIEGRAGLVLHAAMVDRVLRLPTTVFRQGAPAILATQTETVDKFRRSLINYAITFTTAALSGIAAAALMCFYSPAAGLVGIASAVLLLAITGLFGWLQFKAIYEGERMDVVVLTFVYDLIRLVPVLQAQRGERSAFVHWAQNFLAFQSRIMRSTRVGNLLNAFESGWEVLTLGVTFAVVAMVGMRSGSEVLATGAAVAFVISLGKLNAATLQAAHALGGMAKLMPMAKLARSLIEQPVMAQSSGAAVPALRGDVTLKNLAFSYDRRPILVDVSADIAAGEFVGIRGASGSGKSTLLRLLLGLDQPRSGRILIDGLDAADLDRASLSSQIGVVLQNGQLFAGTVFENIRGNSAASLEDAADLAAKVGLGPALAEMPMHLQTLVGAGGVGLARGQIEQILIARALAIKPRILVLDEPSGALRGSEQSALVDLLGELTVTRIVVSHDAALLAGADRLFELREGHLALVRAKDGGAA